MEILTGLMGTRSFTDNDLVTMGIYRWFNRAYRGHAMPHQLEAFKMQEQTGSQTRYVLPALMAAALAGTLGGLWVMLHMNYGLGAAYEGHPGLDPNYSFTRAAAWVAAPQARQLGPTIAIGSGFALALLMQTMRFNYVNWPFHPLGFAISGSWEMSLVWMPLMLAWVIKTLLVKYVGHKAYERGGPIFVGLVLGQFVVGSLVNIISIIYHVPSYMFWQ